jgi:hypothetical protein
MYLELYTLCMSWADATLRLILKEVVNGYHCEKCKRKEIIYMYFFTLCYQIHMILCIQRNTNSVFYIFFKLFIAPSLVLWSSKLSSQTCTLQWCFFVYIISYVFDNKVWRSTCRLFPFTDWRMCCMFWQESISTIYAVCSHECLWW